jgi:hypothetical protein
LLALLRLFRGDEVEAHKDERRVKMNTLKTTFLMALMTVLLVTAGGFLGGEGGA